MSSSSSTAVNTARFIYPTVFVTGAAVMMVEILGTRIIGPFFGVGLFAWSAQLAVALAALAAGYSLGGKWAQKSGSANWVAWSVLAAGVWVALIPLMSRPVLIAADSLGVRAGTLASSGALYGPCLLCLGAVTPLGVELLSRDHDGAGSAAGKIYAVSTVGGLLSTLGTGFFLIPHLALTHIWAIVATVLIGVGVVWILALRMGKAFAATLILPWLTTQAPSDEPLEGVKVLARADSFYGRLAVIEDTNHSVPLRLLQADHSFIGAHWGEPSAPAFGFVHILEAAALARPSATRALQIGLGIGSFSELVRDRGIATDVVEIDPRVVQLAKQYFDYRPTGTVFIEDARTFVAKTKERYDIVVHDSFTGGAIPEHLVTLEVFERIKLLLTPNGVLVLNFVGAVSGELAGPARALRRTIARVFPHVSVYRERSPERDPDGISNVVFFASDSPVRFDTSASGPPSSPQRKKILASFQDWRVLEEVDPAAPVVTDQANPLARLAFPLAERFRASMREMYPREFWLN